MKDTSPSSGSVTSSRTVWTGTDADDRDALEYWADVICATFVGVAVGSRTD